MKPKYLRMESVVVIKLNDGETPEDAEDRFLNALQDDMDIVIYTSSVWDDE